MFSISLKDIQHAIEDSIGINTYDSKEENIECDLYSLLSERRQVSCSERY